MKRHKWNKPFVGVDSCIRCGTVRYTIASIGIRYHRQLMTYIRPDRVRFTGFAPECDPSLLALPKLGLAIRVKTFEETNWYQTWTYTEEFQGENMTLEFEQDYGLIWNVYDADVYDGAPDAGRQMVGRAKTRFDALMDFIDQYLENMETLYEQK